MYAIRSYYAACKLVDVDRLHRLVDLVVGERVFVFAVEPDVVRFDVGAPLEITLDAKIGVIAVIIADDQRFAILVALASRRPIPVHLGGDVAACEFGNVTGLAGDLVGMVVQLGFLLVS